jgi:lipid-A-disaccharide synthase
LKKIFISAGDPSGDAHAARLMNSLKQLEPSLEFTGLGGPAMIAEGLNSIAKLEEISVVGFWEVAKKYFFFNELLNKCKNILKSGDIEAFIPVDYPGFNIRLAGFAKKLGIPVIYYIAPQLWAWGENRAKNLNKVVDILLTVFPFETEFFNKYGINTKFVGHPLLDSPDFENSANNEKRNNNLIAFLPGSRKQEIAKHMPLFNETARLLLKKKSGIEIGLSVSSSIERAEYQKYISLEPKWQLWDNARELMRTAGAGIVKTGTSTLEAALCGMPFAMVYKTSAISYLFGKKLVNLEHISLVNILANKKVVNEYIQSEAIPEKLVEEIINICDNEDRSRGLQYEFIKIREMLGGRGASGKAAAIIANELKWL